jgi:LysR family transcriptional regulator (chromosome initiation inhibitor)
VVVAAVEAGLGWGMVPEVQAAAGLRAGTLVPLVPDRPVDVPLYWQQWKLDLPALSTVAEAVAAVASSSLRSPGSRTARGRNSDCRV